MAYSIGVDIGGTNIAVGLVDKNYNVISKCSFETKAPRDVESICDDIINAYESLLKKENINKEDIDFIGIACPGIIKNGVVISATNLKFTDVPLKEIIENKTGFKCAVCNDANAVALAEYIIQGNDEIHSLVAVTIGTGIGGGIVIDGKIIDGFNGAGAELGHITVELNGRNCSCGNKGCLEAYCSASALVKDTKKAMIDNPESKLWEICKDLNDVDGRTPFIAASMGDATAKELVDNLLKYLTIGVTNIITLLQPEIVCIGGGMSSEEEALIKPLEKMVNENNVIKTISNKTTIKSAVLHNDAGIVGAVAYIREQMQEG